MEPTSLVLLLFFLQYGQTQFVHLSVSPSWWVNVGDSVTLSCQVIGDPSPDWRFSWYRVVPYSTDLPSDRSKRFSVELLADSQRGAGGSYSLSPVGLNHTGTYVCRDEREDTVVKKKFSNPWFLHVLGPSPPVSPSVSPNSVQHFPGESASVSCEEQRNSTGWRVKRFTLIGILSECGTDWGSVTGSTCSFRTDSGVYWCESDSGEYSRAVNISGHYYQDVILESPALPVTEGDAVTLRCRHRTTPNITAEFYKFGSLISTERSGEMTIPSVSASDEGEYSCRFPDLGRSPSSWLSVRAPSPSPSSSPAPAPLMSWSRLLCSIVVSSPYLLTTFILP